MGKLSYLGRSLAQAAFPSRQLCANCGGRGDIVARKYLVTALRRCRSCSLLYRAPTDRQQDAEEFYDDGYRQGMVTDLPSPERLADLKSGNWPEQDNYYARYAELLLRLGAPQGARVFDFGCSWGYGSYQLRQAGFNVKSFELSRPRGQFGVENLDIDLVGDLEGFTAEAAGSFDVFLSSHVLEHVMQPSRAIEMGMAMLKPGGLFVSCFPNGSASLRRSHPGAWMKSWGMVHPNLIDGVFLAAQFQDLPILVGTSPIEPGPADIEHLHAGSGLRAMDGLERHELFVIVAAPR
jgi:SAM-dependent methyltransferase